MLIGERLKHVRKQAKLSQSAVARAANMTPSAISQLELGLTKKPSAENLLPIAKVLNVDPNWLITGKGDPKPAASTPPLQQSNEPQAAYGFQPQISEFQSFASTIFGDAAQIPMMQDIMNQAMGLWLNQSTENQETFAAYLAASAERGMGKPKAELMPMMRQVVQQAMTKFNGDAKIYTDDEIEAIKEQAVQDFIEESKADAHAELSDRG